MMWLFGLRPLTYWRARSVRILAGRIAGEAIISAPRRRRTRQARVSRTEWRRT